jgi:hypothetical protein
LEKLLLTSSLAASLASLGQCLNDTDSMSEARSTQSANIAEDSTHHASFRVQANRWPVETRSAQVLHISLAELVVKVGAV